MTNVQEMFFPPTAPANPALPLSPPNAAPIPPQTDRVYPIVRPPVGQESGGLPGLLEQLMQMLQSFFSGGAQSSSGQPGAANGGNFYQNATASSTGDPHLQFDGTTRNGKQHHRHFDSMSSHGDLLGSDSFAGGYRIATQTTAPGQNGVTYNREADVYTNYGQTEVSLDNGGNASIEQNGTRYALADGQSYDLGNGETVSRNAQGAVVVTDTNAAGGAITTTLQDNGAGVDVNAQANNVRLSGDLLTPHP